VNKLDELENSEVMDFRRDAVNLCKEIVEQREGTVEDHAFYAYSAQVCPTKVPSNLFRDGAVVLKVWIDSSRTWAIKVPREANADTIIRETMEIAARKTGGIASTQSFGDFVLKICGREEYLLGSFPVSQYKVMFSVLQIQSVPPLSSSFLKFRADEAFNISLSLFCIYPWVGFA